MGTYLVTGAAKTGISLLITLVFLVFVLVVPSVRCALRANVMGMRMLETVEAQLATTTYADFWRQQAPLLANKSSWSDESPCPGLPSLAESISCVLRNDASTCHRLSTSAAFTVGFILYENGYHDKGVKTWQRAGIPREAVILTIGPGSGSDMYFQQLIRNTVGLSITDNEQRLRLARFLEVRDVPIEAARMWADATRYMANTSADYWMATGEAARLRDDWEQAAMAYQKAWKLSPTTVFYYQRETAAWMRGNQWDRAEQSAARWREASADSYDALVASARIALERKVYVEAEGLLTTAIEQDSTQGVAYMLLGRLKYALNQPSEALTYLEQALEREPGLNDAADLRAIIQAETAK